MVYTRPPLVLPLISVVMIVACSSDPVEPVQSRGVTDSRIMQQGLLDADWTLETVRGSDGGYTPLPLEIAADDGSVDHRNDRRDSA